METTFERREIRQIALLVNPAAGKGKSSAAAELARRAFAEAGVAVTVLAGASPRESKELIRHSIDDKSLDALVVCGGDGLVSLALQAQAKTAVPLGIIPAGTGNDHAREYHIPLDPLGAVKVITAGYATRTDLGLMRDDEGREKYFGTIACMGFDSLSSARTNSISFPRGASRYVVAGLIEWARFNPRETRIYVDGQEVCSGPITTCVIGNTKSYGGGLEVCPHADPRDGLLELSILGDMTRWGMLRNAGAYGNGTWWKLPQAQTGRGKVIRVEMPAVTAYADGDAYFDSAIECTAVPDAGYYLVPRS